MPSLRSATRVRELRTLASPQWWRDKSGWVNDSPARVAAVLALVGLAVRQAWLSTQPLAAGDWAWRDRLRLESFFPFAHVWDPSLGPGGANRFLAAFRFPVYAAGGVLGHAGASWTFIEKIVYFVPFAVILPVAGWLLAREVMGRTRWTLLSPLLLLGNTYFLVEANGEIPLTLSEAIGILALTSFLRAMRLRALPWAIYAGLFVALASAFDIRPAYLCLVLMALYWLILALARLEWSLLWRRALLGLATLSVYVGSQAFWVLPLLHYHGNPGFPIPPTPDFPIITIAHGLAGVTALWTGGLPAVNVQAPLLGRRLSPEVLWLALAALLFAFFANTDNAPFGGVYDWMYAHIPGWNLFREGSKFLFVVGMAYSILIPTALKMAFDWVSTRAPRWARRLVHVGAATGLAGVVAISISCLIVLESGSLDSSTNPTTEPPAFTSLSAMLAADARTGTVLWVGSGEAVQSLRHHTFVIASPTHPLINLTGTFNPANDVQHRDPFQLFCGDPQMPYCYLEKDLFSYLASLAGAGYVVVPVGQGSGALPRGITRTWLVQQITAMFGYPAVLGDGATELAAWRLPAVRPAVTSGPAVAFVDSGTWAAAPALPALEAMDIPAAYRGTSDANHFPSAPSSLPDSIAVMPRLDGGCQSRHPVSGVAVMARSTAPSLDVNVADRVASLPLLSTAPRLSGWGFFGTMNIGAGETPVAAGDPAVVMGPCVAWSPLTAQVLGMHEVDSGSVRVGLGGEQVTAQALPRGQRWIELHRFYDPGWQLAGKSATSSGDGLLDLYHLKAATGSPARLTFTFSTHTWEQIGLGVAGLVVGGALVVAVVTHRRRGAGVLAGPQMLLLAPSATARWVAGVGIAVLAFTAVAVTAEWFGIPSSVPTAIAGDPYGLDVGYGAAAISVLLVAVAVRIVSHLVRRRKGESAVPSASVRTRAAVAATALVIVALAACGSSAGDLQNTMSRAQQEGAVSRNTEGSSLDEARQQRAAHNAELCIDDYTRAMAAFPDLVQVYTGRGACYMSGGKDSAAAVHDYTRAISLAPVHSDLYLLRAAADRASGNLRAAANNYEQAALAPNATPNHQLTAIDGLIALAEYDRARALYQRVSQRDTGSSALQLAAADIATATGGTAAVDRAYATALQLARNKFEMAQALTRLCNHDVLTHSFAKALIDCHNGAAASPDSSGAYDDLSAAELALGNPESALAYINAAIGAWVGDIGVYAQPGGVDGFGLARLYAARGWIEVHLHNGKAATSDFQLAQAALPTEAPDVRARLKAAIATAQAD